MTADQLTTPEEAEATPDHEPVRPTFTLTEAAQATGTSRSTMKRKLAAGEFPAAAKDADGVWRFSPGDLLAAGLKLRTPADAGRSRRDEDQGDDEAAKLLDRIADLERLLTIERVRRESAEQVAAEREKRAMTAERALLMLEARPAQVTTPHPEPVRPAAAESGARLPADSGFDAPSEFAWRQEDKPMTPRQREVLTERGYRTEDLAGMPRRVASRHIGGELGPEDAHQSRGQRPAEAAAAAGHAQVQEPVKPALAEQQDRQRREQQRRGRGGRHRSS